MKKNRSDNTRRRKRDIKQNYRPVSIRTSRRVSGERDSAPPRCGPEGHQVIIIVAEHYMRPEAAAHMRKLLAPESPEEASFWPDE